LRRDFAGVGLPVRADVDVRAATIDDLGAITEIYNHTSCIRLPPSTSRR